jgi:hypothetical protein
MKDFEFQVLTSGAAGTGCHLEDGAGLSFASPSSPSDGHNNADGAKTRRQWNRLKLLTTNNTQSDNKEGTKEEKVGEEAIAPTMGLSRMASMMKVSNHINQSTVGPGVEKESRPSLAFDLMKFAAEARLMGKCGDDHECAASFSFGQCHILSMSPASIIQCADDPWKLLDHGSRQMDTFIMETTMKSSEVMYKYPKDEPFNTNKHKNNLYNLSPEVLSSFCFPYGISVRLFPRAALEGAMRLGWAGPVADNYQLKAVSQLILYFLSLFLGGFVWSIVSGLSSIGTRFWLTKIFLLLFFFCSLC